MTNKEIKFYQTFMDFSKSDYLKEPSLYLDFLKYAADYDFATGSAMWEVLFVTNEGEITEETAQAFSNDSFAVFTAKSEQKAVKLIVENATLTRALFQYSPHGLDANMTKIVTDFVLTNKLNAADEALKCISRNTISDKNLGECMRMIIERLFVEVLKKVGGGRAVMTKKQTTLLLAHINKIKTAERALLTQRLKELS